MDYREAGEGLHRDVTLAQAGTFVRQDGREGLAADLLLGRRRLL